MLALGGCSAVDRLEVAQVGSFQVGGRPVTLSGLPPRELIPTPGAPAIKVDPNGDFEVEAMYVRYTRLLQPRAAYPLLLWHGGGLTGVSFETKPDGQPGWEDFFLKAGHSVYVSDSVERGRASWARYPEIFKTEPFFRSKKEAWELFRIGAAGSYATDPSRRQALPGSQFPIESFDQFMKQGVPRWSTNDAATQAAYNEYVSKVCPCVILVHSQGANFAYEAALAYPNKVKALVLVEPTGSPDPAKTDFAKLRNTPMLWIWADNTEKYALWQTLVARQEKFREGVKAAGGVADLVQLPAVGIRGNSHMMMMDRNSDAIAQLIQGWIDKHGLMR
ncbi:esterase [Variovorax paradoxus]|nr:esterase [Variovorax paradoxus]